MNQIMNTEQACAFLQMDAKALRYHIRLEHIKATKLGRDYLMERADVEAFRDKRARGEHVR
jgi:hypothetical protein